MTGKALSLRRRFIPLPPKYESDWDSVTHFPVGTWFVGGVIGEELILWGGIQDQSKENPFEHLLLNPDWVYSFHVGRGKWRKMAARGDIHRGTLNAGHVVYGDLVYIFGGSECNWDLVNDISTLSADGKFDCLKPSGTLPSPRSNTHVWLYYDSLYFYGGYIRH